MPIYYDMGNENFYRKESTGRLNSINLAQDLKGYWHMERLPVVNVDNVRKIGSSYLVLLL